MPPLAARRNLDDLFDQSFWAGIGLVVALLVLAWVIFHLRAWFGDDTDHTDDGRELLTHLKQLRAEGEVTDEEFRSIKGRITERRERTQVEPAQGADSPSEPTPTDDGEHS